MQTACMQIEYYEYDDKYYVHISEKLFGQGYIVHYQAEYTTLLEVRNAYDTLVHNAKAYHDKYVSILREICVSVLENEMAETYDSLYKLPTVTLLSLARLHLDIKDIHNRVMELTDIINYNDD